MLTKVSLYNIDPNGSFSQTYKTTTGNMDLSLCQIFKIDVSAPVTFSFSNVPASLSTTVKLQIKDGGSHQLTWPANVKWTDGLSPILSETNVDLVTFETFDGGISWQASVSAKNII